MDEQKSPGTEGAPKPAPAPAPAPAAAPAPAPEKPAEGGGGGIDARLILLCLMLWVCAGIIAALNWGEAKRNYYWGNIKQSLDMPPHRPDAEAIEALVKMGDAVLPSCEYELGHHPDARFRTAVVKVVENVQGSKARDLLDWTAKNDIDPRVKSNAVLALRSRAVKSPEEKPALIAAGNAALAATGEAEPVTRSVWSLVLAEFGESKPVITQHLVFAFREVPALRGEAATRLAAAIKDVPPFKLEGAKEKDFIAAVTAYESWCTANGISQVGSAMSVAPVKSDGVGPVGSK